MVASHATSLLYNETINNANIHDHSHGHPVTRNVEDAIPYNSFTAFTL